MPTSDIGKCKCSYCGIKIGDRILFLLKIKPPLPIKEWF